MSNLPPTSPGTVRWNPWPVSIIAFFSVAIAAFGVFVWFCTRHPAELVAADYYDQELRYQGQIDRMQNAQRVGAEASVTYDPATKSILISLPAGSTSLTTTGQVQLYRPSAVNLDRQFKLEPDAGGAQRIDAAALQPGLWKVRVSWTVGKVDYFIDRKVVIESRPS